MSNKTSTSGSIWEYLEASGSFWEHLGAPGSIWEPLGASGSIWSHLGASGSLHCSGCLLFWKSIKKFAQTSGSIWDHLGASGSLHALVVFYSGSLPANLLKLLGASGSLHFCGCLLFWKSARKFAQTSGSACEHLEVYILLVAFYPKLAQASGSMWEHLGIYMFLVASLCVHAVIDLHGLG